MAYTVTTKNSYGSRLSNSLRGVGFGFVLLILGTVLIFWNEKRTAHRADMLKQAQKECVELGDIAILHPEMEGRLVHATGMASTTEVLNDPQFGVEANAVKLIRRVQYYQWVENSTTTRKDKIGGSEEVTTTYDYDLQWVDDPVDSREFHDPSYRDANSILVNIDDKRSTASNVDFGAYKLSSKLVSQISGEVPLNLDLSEGTLASLKAMLPPLLATDSLSHVTVLGNTVYFKGDAKTNSDDVGDVKVTFTQVPAGNVSIMASVSGNTFTDFVAKKGSLQTLYEGTHSMEDMIQSEKQGNKAIGWLLRLLGFLLLYLGFRNIFDILKTLLKVLPFLASIMGLGVSIVSFVLALVWGLLVAGVGIIIYNPLVGGLVLGAAVVIFILASLSKKGKAAKAELLSDTPQKGPEQ